MLTHVSYSNNVNAQLWLYSLVVSNVHQSYDVIISLAVGSSNLVGDILFFCPRGNDVTVFELINLWQDVKITFDCGTYLSGKYVWDIRLQISLEDWLKFYYVKYFLISF